MRRVGALLAAELQGLTTRRMLATLWPHRECQRRVRQSPIPDIGMARQFWAEYRRGLYAMPRAWAHKGENLVHAFEVVAFAAEENGVDVRDQALMLAGMAIEVLLKATLVDDPK